MVIGLRQGTVELYPWSPEWPTAYETERTVLQEALGASALDIQHVGSTAVPGLCAKPIIDIAVAVTRYEEAFALVDRVVALGYAYLGEYGIPRRHFFVKGNGDIKTHHVHMVERDGPDWAHMTAFRDALRAHPELAAAYGRLKRDLADAHAADRDAYTRAKSAFIEAALREERTADNG